MPFVLRHTTPKCTTDACRAMRHLTHVMFESYEVALAFIRAHNLTNVSIHEIRQEGSHDALGSAVEAKRRT